MTLLPPFTKPNDDITPLLNKIHHADCFELLARIPDNSIDMVLCDLPYGATQAFYDSIIPLQPLWLEVQRVCRNRSAIVFTAQQPFTSVLVSSNYPMFRYEWIWQKRRKTNFLNAKKIPLTAHESILVFGYELPLYYPQMTESEGHTSGSLYDRGSILYGKFQENYYEKRNTYYPSSVIEFGHDPEMSTTYTQNKNKIPTHPNQKPVALFEYLIKTYTQENEIVLDMTCGSGTTAIAARKTNRQFICGDYHLPYVEIARQRLQTTDPYQATDLGNGQKQLSLFEDAS